MSYNNLNHVEPDELNFNVQADSEGASSRRAHHHHNGEVSYIKASDDLGDWDNNRKNFFKPKCCNCCCCVYIILGFGLLFCSIFLYVYFAYIQYIKEPLFTKVYFQILTAGATENPYDGTLLFSGDGNVIVTAKNYLSVDATMTDMDLSIYFKDWINITVE